MTKEPKADRPPAPGWQRFLESSGGTALITVVLGGIAGQLITATWQNKLKDRERGMAAYAEYVKQEREIVTRTYELVGQGIAAAEDLVTLLDPAFDLSKFDGEEARKMSAQREAIRRGFNEADSKWRASRESLALLMGYYHHADATVNTAWLAAETAMTVFMDCAQQAYLRGQAVTSGQMLCRTEHGTLRQRLTDLTASFEVARAAHSTDLR